MTSRQKPQQQLQCYFSELLTELEEPQSVAQPLPKTEDLRADTTTDTSSDVSSAHPSINVQNKQLTDDKPSLSEEPTKSSLKNLKASIPVKTDSQQPKPAFTAKHVSHQGSFSSQADISSPQPARHKQTTASIDESPIYEQQKQKLEQLLKSLSPVNSSAKPLVDKKVLDTPQDQDIINNDVQIEDSVDAVGLETQDAAHQWQPLSSDWESGRPVWGQSHFDVLLVSVSGIDFALPLAALDGIYPIEDEITPLFAQAKWFMGLHKTPIGNVRVVNTTAFIMPEKASADDINGFKYSVTLNGSGWALAVDSINQPISIDPDGIRWRANRAARPWMAGMLKEQMCVLLDIPVLTEVLIDKDQNRME